MLCLKSRRDKSAMRKKKKNVRSSEIPGNNSVWGKRVERTRVVPNFYSWMQKSASSFWSLSPLVNLPIWKAGFETTFSALVSSYLTEREKIQRLSLLSANALVFSIFTSGPEFPLQLFHRPSSITSWKPLQFTDLCLHPTPHALCLYCKLHQGARCWMYLFRSLVFWGDSRHTPQD